MRKSSSRRSSKSPAAPLSRTAVAHTNSSGTFTDALLAVLPLLPSVALFFYLGAPQHQYKVGVSVAISLCGFALTSLVIPIVSDYTLRKGLSGKDLGKKGSPGESQDIPEALGIASGTVFLVCTIASQLIFARGDSQELVVYNSALFSICFMIFLGFTDDTLDLKWRYKLILPTVASLPLLSAYSGNTAVFIPAPFRFLLFAKDAQTLTTLGALVDVFVTVDVAAHGAIIELGPVFLVFMGLLAVFCTNSINILAGINGLECGQSYIIGCSILFFKMYDLVCAGAAAAAGGTDANALFAVFITLPFIATSLALLRFNWFPAKVFVGDTFCYFAGMTFAVVGIHGHFSKTLLLLFLPQVFNFIYSTPQLFRLVPCPRHRLPRVDPETRLMHPSSFPCAAHEYRLPFLKRAADDTECPNLTILCAVLRVFGPMSERSLTLTLLVLQGLCSCLAFFVRYVLFADANE